MQFIEPQTLLNATDGGLDIIIMLYPQASGVAGTKKKFKVKNEKTASANLVQRDGNWLVTDFGDDSKPRDGIACYAKEKGVDWSTALQELATIFKIAGSAAQIEKQKPTFSKRPATPEENEGVWSFDLRNSFSDSDIETVISKNVLSYLNWKSTDEEKHKAAYAKIAAIFKEYRWHSVVSYSIIKNRETLIFSSNDDYPIFLIDEGTHQKLYQPFNQDKGKRFMYHGKKPSVFIHGLVQLQTAFEESKDQLDDDDAVDFGSEGEPLDTLKKKKKKDPRLPEVIMCSGGSDAINIALLGYRVLWMNSETAKLYPPDYDKIAICVLKFYNLPDIDKTGLNQAHLLAMQYLEMHTIEIPKELLLKKDRRFNPCKDVRDYFNHHYRKDFKELVEGALPYRFWEKKPKFIGKGDDRVFAGFDYEFDNVQAYNFLNKNGFHRMRVGDKKSDWIFIRIQGNTVSEIDANDVKNFVHEFLRERMLDKTLRNTMFRTNQLSEASLNNLAINDIEFKDFDRDFQMLFFNNKTLKITKDGVEEFKPGDFDCYTWEEEVLPHHYEKPKQEPFTVTWDAEGNFDIEIHNRDCMFFNYLTQASRVHWRAELEERIETIPEENREAYLKENHCNIAGSLLTADEILEQKRHLINKLYVFGYHMHRYKQRSKAVMTYVMDWKNSDDGQAHGGSGKSIFLDVAMRKIIKKTFVLSGRNPKLSEDPHKYDGLTEHHRYLLIDDAHEHLNLGVFYNDVTGDTNVNPKGKKPYVIPFEVSPKIAIGTNYTPKNLGPSTERRMLYCVFSDYYHNKGESTDYHEKRDPVTDFGKELFTDFNQTEYNHFYNTVIHALKLFMSVSEPIGPGMGNVNKRNLLSEMGLVFHDWALAYFAEESTNRDELLVREYVYEDFRNANPGKWTSQSFFKRIKAFCKYYGYILNPKVLHNTENHKIIHRAEEKYFDHRDKVWRTVQGDKKTKEMFYIQTEDYVQGFEPEGYVKPKPPAAGEEGFDPFAAEEPSLLIK